MKTRMIALALLATATSAPAAADNIDFGQFGPENTILSGPLRGVTNDGVGFTLIGSSVFKRLNAGSTWAGDFQNGRELLYMNRPGQMVFYFDNSLTSLNSIAVAPNSNRPYTATLKGFAAGVLGPTSTSSGGGGLPGPIGDMAISGAFDSVTLSTTEDDNGFAVGGADAILPPPPPVGGVPEPATWLTLITGLGLVGFAMRQSGRRRRPQPVAA